MNSSSTEVLTLTKGELGVLECSSKVGKGLGSSESRCVILTCSSLCEFIMIKIWTSYLNSLDYKTKQKDMTPGKRFVGRKTDLEEDKKKYSVLP